MKENSGVSAKATTAANNAAARGIRHGGIVSGVSVAASAGYYDMAAGMRVYHGA